MLAVIGHDIVSGNECRYISLCLTGQILVDSPVVLHTSGTVNGLVDVLRTVVIGRNHQVPVIVDFIEVA